MLPEVQPDPTVALAHAVAAAVVRDTDDRPAMLRAAAAIASGDERAASRLGIAWPRRSLMSWGTAGLMHRVTMRNAAANDARSSAACSLR